MRQAKHKTKLNAEFRKDLAWRLTFLSNFNGRQYYTDRHDVHVLTDGRQYYTDRHDVHVLTDGRQYYTDRHDVHVLTDGRQYYTDRHNVHVLTDGRQYYTDRHDVHVLTDACRTASGCLWAGDWHYSVFHADWPKVTAMHINCKEVCAVASAVARWAPLWAGRTVVVAYRQCRHKGDTE